MADGNPRDTIPSPAPRAVKGTQSERDGALIPDAYGELPWPRFRQYGSQPLQREMTIDIELRQIGKSCMGGECGEFGFCERHGQNHEDCGASRVVTVAEAAVQIEDILREALARTVTLERDARHRMIDDILAEARRLL